MSKNDVFDSLFHFELAKSAVPAGSELMARTGMRDNETKGKGRTGRPPKASQPAIDRIRLNVDPENPSITALALDPDDSNRWLAGSVVRVVFSDGEERTVVLLDDTSIVPWIDE
ncbi:hypothetical protein Psta_0454 [Pirellula staleyi DSM 6068]|uniref:Uncharacterized protein n=1 Tax=Pirellula staleyi (strain ATCC 27377 / DSM 6068 / ICPB 4128) TaxID=530564 RepID=D2R3B1_PIRSD|nr:hypothetical protein Psta_0454 [Pirellula staleyi DSM 6068]